MQNRKVSQKITSDFIKFVNELVDDNTKIASDTKLFDLGLIDSLSVLDLIAFVESYFHIKVKDNDITLDNFRTVQHMIDKFSTDYGSK